MCQAVKLNPREKISALSLGNRSTVKTWNLYYMKYLNYLLYECPVLRLGHCHFIWFICSNSSVCLYNLSFTQKLFFIRVKHSTSHNSQNTKQTTGRTLTLGHNGRQRLKLTISNCCMHQFLYISALFINNIKTFLC